MSERIEFTNIEKIRMPSEDRDGILAYLVSATAPDGRIFYARSFYAPQLVAEPIFDEVVLTDLRGVYRHLTSGAMSENIEPALSAEEWTAKLVMLEAWRGRDTAVSVDGSPHGITHFVLRSHDTWRGEPYTAAVHATPHNLVPIIALANAALPDDDPRKITREKIRDILSSAEQLRLNPEFDDDVPMAERLEAFADALESYLPPETR